MGAARFEGPHLRLSTDELARAGSRASSRVEVLERVLGRLIALVSPAGW